jgi:hypothetical protein
MLHNSPSAVLPFELTKLDKPEIGRDYTIGV